jgi:thiol-disulfide isomerase/thioredoxin
MTGFRTRVFAGVAVFSLLAASTAACGGSSKPAASASSSEGEGGGGTEVGKPAPDLALDTLNGKGKISNASLQGKVVIVDFWATWCGPCKQSFPKLEELSKKYAGKLEIVGVSCDEEKDGVADWAKLQGATFAIAWDEGHKIAPRWNVKTMPTSFILDSSGNVRHIHAAYHDDEPELMDKEIVALMNEPTKAKTAVASSSSDKDKDNVTSPNSATPPPGGATASGDEPDKPEPATTAVKPKPGAKKPGAKPAAKKPGGKPKK